MASIGVSQVRASMDLAASIAAALSAVDSELERQASIFRTTTDGTAVTLPGDGLAQLDQGRAKLQEALSLLSAGSNLWNDYLASIGEAAGPTTATGPVGSPAARPATGPARRLEGFNPKREHPDAVGKAKRDGWPKNARGNTSARAALYGKDGTQLGTETYRPRHREDPESYPELKDEFNDPGKSTTWHVEGEIAKDIRTSRQNECAVYINVPLCGAPNPQREFAEPNGCAENFRHVVPDGTVVYVYTVPENGTTRRRRVIGTGEGIKDESA